MKNKNLIGLLGILIAIVLIVVLLGGAYTGQVIKEQKILGYCPTMASEAQLLAEEHSYLLREFDSASIVLRNLKSKEIDYALIGRKAYAHELSQCTNEMILKSGFTLVSNQRGFIDVSQLNNFIIYAPEGFNELNLSNTGFYSTKQEAIKLINQRKIVLISWEDWQDDFELIIAMNGSEKARDFRGAFLYN